MKILLLLLLGAVAASGQTVHVITLDGTINPASAEYIHHGIRRAAEANAEAIVIRINTPGGLLSSTRDIVTDLLTAPLPVVVYVAPSGSQSASAGAFVTLAAHVAAMAPGTNIGAAHPVGMQGSQPDSIMNEKATNDAAAFIRTISEKRHRNVQWAENAVRKSVSITETEAMRDSVIDLIAPTIDSLLSAIDGRTVDVEGKPHLLKTRGAKVELFEMGWKEKILDILSDPNIAYIFFLLGIYGLFFELYNPGSVLPGIVGVISIILAFYSFQTLPVNYAGVALILVGIVLLLLEIKITSYGLLSVGGAISLFLGSIMLINTDSSLEFISISWAVIIPSVLCTILFFLFAVGMGIRAQRRKPVTGEEGLIGLEGETLVAIPLPPGEGQVRVHGELWRAQSAAGAIPPHTPVKVVKVEGLLLIVAPVTA